MSFGSIIYYILWPIVAIAILIYWAFSAISFFLELCVEVVRGFHEDIKKF
ncbi:MAG TPA: hypothetical protein PJ997_01940 [Candidatus Paceibacterota bacterium]|nr:hypothetical protein [Candidatus Paceibacterota bacterium]HMP19076.1 hypothetical protein [Candidatus Paceibacterota bacterium]HMP85426.1 hypothetical protein [Candidatus Paceibacterota bacterium]